MLWFLGRPRLLLPARLIGTLNAESWRSILAHELAHIRRRDHWLRRIELAAGLFWWWNPLYWLTKRRLEAEAELACDEWAVRVFPEERVAYAEALLEICRSLSPPVSPAPALGVAGTGRFLERRVTMILRDLTPSRAPTSVLLGAAVLSLVAMPCWSPSGAAAPSHAALASIARPTEFVAVVQDDDDDDEKSDRKAAERAKRQAERARRLEERAKRQAEAKKHSADSAEHAAGKEKELAEKHEEIEKKMQALGKEMEAKFGPGSEFQKEMEKKFGPDSQFAKEMEAKFGPGSEFAKEVEKKFGAESDFAASLGKLKSKAKVEKEAAAPRSAKKAAKPKPANSTRELRARQAEELRKQIKQLSRKLRALEEQLDDDEDEDDDADEESSSPKID
jgi:hypothetical protein